ncbi:MAG: hypothetical protein EKK61_04350 [Rickettsiales bacterium]|nr:MAG: hypothetical protein EKK61_04350 [Rickettsiales bacterium]
MITYSITPNNRPPQAKDPKNKPKLPTFKGHLFFTTSDEYKNIEANPKYSDKQSIFKLENLSPNPTLIKANSVVEYECGITLNHEDEIDHFLDMLLIKAKGLPKVHEYFDNTTNQIAIDYSSDYHLEHNYKDAELTIEQKQALTDRGFPDMISVPSKNFVLKSVGIDLSKDMIDQSVEKGRHIVIIYKNEDNNGYLKFKKPETPSANATVCEIDKYSEHDAIYVNIHFTKKDPRDNSNFNFDEQLQNIGQTFKYFTNGEGSEPKIPEYKYLQLKNYFTQLTTDFKKLVGFVPTNYGNCQELFDETNTNFKDCTIKIGKTIISAVQYLPGGTKNLIKNSFPVNFNNNNSENFLSLGIHNEKLEAPLELNDILNYTPPPTANLVVSSGSEDESSEDDQVIAPNNDDVNAVTTEMAALIVDDPAAQPIQIEAQILAIDNGAQDPYVALLAVPTHEVSDNTDTA